MQKRSSMHVYAHKLMDSGKISSSAEVHVNTCHAEGALLHGPHMLDVRTVLANMRDTCTGTEVWPQLQGALHPACWTCIAP